MEPRKRGFEQLLISSKELLISSKDLKELQELQNLKELQELQEFKKLQELQDLKDSQESQDWQDLQDPPPALLLQPATHARPDWTPVVLQSSSSRLSSRPPVPLTAAILKRRSAARGPAPLGRAWCLQSVPSAGGGSSIGVRTLLSALQRFASVASRFESPIDAEHLGEIQVAQLSEQRTPRSAAAQGCDG